MHALTLTVSDILLEQAGVCSIFSGYLPAYCVCTDAALGGILNCTVPITCGSYNVDTSEYGASIVRSLQPPRLVQSSPMWLLLPLLTESLAVGVVALTTIQCEFTVFKTAN